MKVKTHDGALSGVVDILGVRKAPGGKPLLELRTQFYELASALPVRRAAAGLHVHGSSTHERCVHWSPDAVAAAVATAC